MICRINTVETCQDLHHNQNSNYGNILKHPNVHWTRCQYFLERHLDRLLDHSNSSRHNQFQIGAIYERRNFKSKDISYTIFQSSICIIKVQFVTKKVLNNID